MADGYTPPVDSLDNIIAQVDAGDLYMRHEISDERYIATLKALGVDHDTAVTKCMAIDSVRKRP
jgi:hypothetical protein